MNIDMLQLYEIEYVLINPRHAIESLRSDDDEEVAVSCHGNVVSYSVIATTPPAALAKASEDLEARFPEYTYDLQTIKVGARTKSIDDSLFYPQSILIVA